MNINFVVKYFVTISIFLVIAHLFFFEMRSKPAVSYEKIIQDNPKNIIHCLTIDPSQASLKIVTAQDMVVGTETVSSMAQRVGAIAAINGGHFLREGYEKTLFKGIPQGLLKAGVEILSDSWWHFVFGWNNDNSEMMMGKIEVRGEIIIDEEKFSIHRINQPRKKGEVILYTSKFYKTTLTDDCGTEIIIVDNKIKEIRKGEGNSAIPKDGFVYSFDSDSTVDVDSFQPGQSTEISFSYISHDQSSSNELEKLDYIVEGVPLLVKDGKRIVNFEMQTRIPSKEPYPVVMDPSFEKLRHPRAAIGITNEKKLVFVCVDGHDPDESVGMTLEELAIFMHEKLECQEACNVDGGGSTTLYFDEEVKNTPSGELMDRLERLARKFFCGKDSTLKISDKKERPVSYAIVVLAKDIDF